MKAALAGSVSSIASSSFTTAAGLLAAIGLFAPSAMIGEVCITLSIGSLVAILLILLVLPGLIACCDRFIR